LTSEFEKSLLEETFLGNSSTSSPNNTGKSKRYENNKLEDECTTFSDLCQEKLNNEDYSGGQITEMFSFISKIDQSFCLNPLVNVQKIVHDYLSGLKFNELVKKHMILDKYKINSLVKSLGLKRESYGSYQRTSLDKNLQIEERAQIFDYINKYSEIFRDELNLLYSISWSRASIILLLYSQKKITLKLNKFGLVEEGIKAYLETVGKEKEFEKINNSLNKFGIRPIDELIEHNIIQKINLENDFVELSINEEMTQIEDFILKKLSDCPKDSIIPVSTMTYGTIIKKLIEENLLCQYAPMSGVWDPIFDKLIKEGKIKRTLASFMLRPYQDQISLVQKQKEKIKRTEEAKKEQPPQKKFFGRKIDPITFLNELEMLEKGGIDDEDDQVTRIAGMVLSNSTMLKAPSEILPIFDFAMDITNYEFTDEQKEVMKKSKIALFSKIIHAKVMINERILTISETIDEVKQELPSGEQAIIITNLSPKFPELIELREKLPEDKSIQIIDREQFTLWAIITPVIPARKNSICKVRFGDNFGKIVQITSSNYETGMATFEIFPDMNDGSDYIGGLEEIIQSISDPNDHLMVMENYKEILLTLSDLSTEENFNAAMSLKIKDITILNKERKSSFQPIYEKEFGFGDAITKLNDMNNTKITYDCTCEYSNKENNNKYLCEHQIASLNRKCLDEMLYDESFAEGNILRKYFRKMKFGF